MRELSAQLRDGLAAFGSVRGLGLLLAVELDRPAAPVVAAALEHGLVLGSAGENTLRLTPPLTLTADEAELGAPTPERGADVTTKFERQGTILRLVQQQPLSTQAEVAEALRANGIDAVQATVSRDITQLGLVKVRNARRPARLRAARRRRPRPHRGARRARCGAGWASRSHPGRLLVIKTPRGFAAALADAIDIANLHEVAGTIAGDNTVFVACRDGVTPAELSAELRSLL